MARAATLVLARAYLSRGARLWLITRALVCGAFLLVGTNPLQLSLVAEVGIVVLSVVLGFVETYGRRERVFLANLGTRPIFLTALFAAPAMLGEVALRVVAAAL